MKVVLEVTLEGKTGLEISAEVETFADLSKLAKKIDANVRGVKKLLPDVASKKLERVKIATE